MTSTRTTTKKKALIIGNNDYECYPLQSCVNDAQDISDKLRSIGFDVILACNYTYKQMSMIIEEFTENITHQDFVVFFFSGHGYQGDGNNYLIAIDNKCIVEKPNLCKNHATCAQRTLADMEDKSPLVVIFLLDCCRMSIESFGRTKAMNQQQNSMNFVPMQVTAGSLIAFACGPNQKALDIAPNNRNGLFTYHLLQRIAEPNMRVEELMAHVSAGVCKDTNGKLRVHRTSSLSTLDVYLNDTSDQSNQPCIKINSSDQNESLNDSSLRDPIHNNRTSSISSSTSKKSMKLVNDEGDTRNTSDRKYDLSHQLPLPITSNTLTAQPSTSPTVRADDYTKISGSTTRSPQRNEKPWLRLLFVDEHETAIMKPKKLETMMEQPPRQIPSDELNRIAGSMLAMAIGDALGAHVEFRPHEYLVDHPVTDLQAGGTWGLEKGQFTDDTSMALCLANSLIACHGFNLYDQLVRYKWWYRHGYMSSTGKCFDIGNATKDAIEEFEQRQMKFAKQCKIHTDSIDFSTDPRLMKKPFLYCSSDGVAGNGALMRLAPVPLFFFRHPPIAVEYSGRSGQITHGDRKVYDTCRYYGALIVAALQGYTKDQLLDRQFYQKHVSWFGRKDLHPDIMQIAEGSYQKSGGYAEGIRGGGYIVKAMEAALWAFWSTNDFEKGALAAVNLGDDTDATAAIYGQLAGAFYGLDQLPGRWLKEVYAYDFLLITSQWLGYEGSQCYQKMKEDGTLLSMIGGVDA